MANEFLNKIADYGSDKSQDIKSPATLFINSLEGSKYGQIYLFSQFGQANTSSLSLNSQITTHYTEENYAVNDHWALEPEKYTLTGLIGELIYRPAKGWSSKVIQPIKNYLAPLGAISPTFDNYTQSAINITNAVEESFKRYENIAKKALRSIGLGDSLKVANQQFVIQQLKDIRDSRQLISIYTPYGTFDNMAIVSINANQEGSKYQSSLEIQLQRWRTNGSETRGATKEEKSMLAKTQGAIAKQLGITSTTEANINQNSTLKNLINPQR